MYQMKTRIATILLTSAVVIIYNPLIRYKYIEYLMMWSPGSTIVCAEIYV